jgi:hypothetical protein
LIGRRVAGAHIVAKPRRLSFTQIVWPKAKLKKKNIYYKFCRPHRHEILMKRPTSGGNGKENGRERKKARPNHESLFMIIPIEVIHLIVAR